MDTFGNKVIMSNNTESLLSKIDSINPESILRNHNHSLPGLESQEIFLDAIPSVPDPGECSFTLNKQHELNLNLRVQDMSLLSSVFCEFYKFQSDYLAVCGKTYAYVFDQKFKTLQSYCIKTLNEDFLTVSWGVLNGDLFLALAGYLGNIYVLNLQNYKNQKILEGHVKSINCVRFIPSNCELLLSASEDLSIRLWHIKTQVVISLFKSHIQGVMSLDIHQSQQIFISGGKDSALKIWSLLPVQSSIELARVWSGKGFNSLEILKPTFSEHKLLQGYVDCVKFFGNLIICKSQTGEIIIWKTTGAEHDIITVVKVLRTSSIGEINVKFTICKRKKILVIGNSIGECFFYKLDWTHSDEIMYKLSENEGIVRSVEVGKEHVIISSTSGKLQIYSFDFFISKVIY
jgi:polycomb protein EED